MIPSYYVQKNKAGGGIIIYLDTFPCLLGHSVKGLKNNLLSEMGLFKLHNSCVMFIGLFKTNITTVFWDSLQSLIKSKKESDKTLIKDMIKQLYTVVSDNINIMKTTFLFKF